MPSLVENQIGFPPVYLRYIVRVPTSRIIPSKLPCVGEASSSLIKRVLSLHFVGHAMEA